MRGRPHCAQGEGAGLVYRCVGAARQCKELARAPKLLGKDCDCARDNIIDNVSEGVLDARNRLIAGRDRVRDGVFARLRRKPQTSYHGAALCDHREGRSAHRRGGRVGAEGETDEIYIVGHAKRVWAQHRDTCVSGDRGQPRLFRPTLCSGLCKAGGIYDRASDASARTSLHRWEDRLTGHRDDDGVDSGRELVDRAQAPAPVHFLAGPADQVQLATESEAFEIQQ